MSARIRELALGHPRYGYRRVRALLGREGWEVNVKRVHRLWRKEGLRVVKKQQKRRRLLDGSSANACHRKRAERMNHVWSFDFCFDRTADGRALKVFSVLDEYTRECLAIETHRRITGAEVVGVLSALMSLRGVPSHLRCDNGPEFVCSAVRGWLKRKQVSALYIAPGSPWENAYAESYHARLRDEVLDREEFGTLAEACAILDSWREEYNEHRPHGSLGYQTPESFAARCRQAEAGSAALRRLGEDGEGEEEEDGKEVIKRVAL